jgi:hypothetical protein
VDSTNRTLNLRVEDRLIIDRWDDFQTSNSEHSVPESNLIGSGTCANGARSHHHSHRSNLGKPCSLRIKIVFIETVAKVQQAEML